MLVNELCQGGIRAILAYDRTVFDDMALPEGIDQQEVVDHILFKYGNTPLFSPDPAVMKYYIQRWSNHRLTQWERFKKAIEAEYNPIENYDRTEEHKDSFKHGHNVSTDDDITNKSTIENLISADDAQDYQPDAKGLQDSKNSRDISEKHSGTDERTINSRIHGNIGVTTSQQMLESELDLIPRLDVVDYIADDFKNEFCLYIY